jgi:hypothetical protein
MAKGRESNLGRSAHPATGARRTRGGRYWACGAGTVCRARAGPRSDAKLTWVHRQPFDLLDVLPHRACRHRLNFNWRRELLWELDLPVEDVPVTDLRWLLSMPVWSLDGEPFKVSPEQVRAYPARHQAHYARALAADLSYPLHVLVRANEPDRVVTVLDGFHRLFKAVLTGQSMITVKKVPEHLLDMIACR